MSTNKTPVIFIHGLWIHSSAWQPWLDLFATHGYPVRRPAGPATPTPSRRPGTTPTPSTMSGSPRSSTTTPHLIGTPGSASRS